MTTQSKTAHTPDINRAFALQCMRSNPHMNAILAELEQQKAEMLEALERIGHYTAKSIIVNPVPDFLSIAEICKAAIRKARGLE